MKTFPLLALMLLAVFAPAKAGAAECAFPSDGDVALTLNKRPGELVFHYDRSRSQLARLQQASGRATSVAAGWTAVGLTLTELQYRIAIKLEALPLGASRYCARLTAVEASLGYDKIDVFVASEYRPNSCAHRSILDHEMTHAAVFQRALDTYYPRVQRRIDLVARSIGPISAASPASAAKRLQQKLKTEIDPLFRQLNRQLDIDNARLDTPERYRQEQARCSDW